jgi:hypothetical protein
MGASPDGEQNAYAGVRYSATAQGTLVGQLNSYTSEVSAYNEAIAMEWDQRRTTRPNRIIPKATYGVGRALGKAYGTCKSFD